MFKSFCLVEIHFGYNVITDLYSFSYRLHDTDFIEDAIGEIEIGGPGFSSASFLARRPIVATIDVYERRKLNVPANLVLCLKWCHTNYGGNIVDIINWNAKYNSKFRQYREDVEKYLALM